MARIRGKNTLPELAVRRALRDQGMNYRLHAAGLPGRPDIVFRKAKVAIFVHGCFWHRHPGCRKLARSKPADSFWQAKFAANVARDRRSILALEAMGWRIGLIWECETKGEDLELAVQEVRSMIFPTSDPLFGPSS